MARLQWRSGLPLLLLACGGPPQPAPQPPAAYELPAHCGGLDIKVYQTGRGVPDSLRADEAPRPVGPMPDLRPPPGRPWKYRARVLARFVVDSFGYPIPCTWELQYATDAEYARIAREALPRLRYEPARRAHQRVAALVRESITWRPPVGYGAEPP